MVIFYHRRLCGSFCVLRPPPTPPDCGNEYTFVCWDGKLMPENFPAGQLLRKADKCYGVSSVADPGYISRIQKQQQKRGVKKKFVVITFYVSTNFTKLQIILVLKC
jgi:hypothetical protein